MINVHYSKIRSEEDLQDQFVAHSIVASLCPPDKGRALFRTEADDEGTFILLQSPARPRFDLMPQLNFQTKAIHIELEKGNYGFRVFCNPVRLDTNGKRIGVIQETDRKTWLDFVFGQGGGMKPVWEATSSSFCGIRQLSRDRRKITACAVMFSGAVEIQDTEKAEQLLLNGIGKCKAFGFGLVTLRRLR